MHHELERSTSRAEALGEAPPQPQPRPSFMVRTLVVLQLLHMSSFNAAVYPAACMHIYASPKASNCWQLQMSYVTDFGSLIRRSCSLNTAEICLKYRSIF